jgi:uncharacterized protein YkwD
MRLFVLSALPALFLAADPPAKEPTDAEKVRTTVLEGVNDLRKKADAPPLKVNETLQSVAQKHTENLARQDKVGDDGKDPHQLDGKRNRDRVTEAGYAWEHTAENIVTVILPGAEDKMDPVKYGEHAVASWRKSPGHYRDLMNPVYAETGIGYARSKTGKLFCVQVFAKPREEGQQSSQAGKACAVLFDSINELRKKKDVPALVRKGKLDGAAQKHADNLAQQDKLGDDGKDAHILDGKGPADRVTAEGYNPLTVRENIGGLVLPKSDAPLDLVKEARETASGWDKSPLHRANFMNRECTETGIGFARSKTGKVFFVQVFAAPREDPAPAQRPAEPNAEADKARAAIFDGVNELRKKGDVPALVSNAKLDAAAQKHADNLAKQDKIGDDGKNPHVLDGKDGGERITAEGYEWKRWQENIAYPAATPDDKTDPVKLARDAVSGWDKSPGHKKNLMYPEATETGIGFARSKTGKLFYVQVFATPRETLAPAQQPTEAEKARTAVFEGINALRKKGDVPVLARNTKLDVAAQKYAENLARLDKEGGDGENLDHRITAEGYKPSATVENINLLLLAKADAKIDPVQTGKDCVAVWDKSPGHRANLMGKEFTETGIGFARSKTGKVFCVQVFARPKESNE